MKSSRINTLNSLIALRKSSKPRIAVIGLKGLPALGGAATVGENLVRNLKNDFDFTVLSVASHTEKHNTSIEGVAQVIFKSFGKGSLNTLVYYLLALLHVFRRRYDIIHLHHAESGFITPFLRLKYKVIVTFHGVYSYDDTKFSKLHNWFFRLSERLNVKYANEVVSVSLPGKSFIQQKYNREVVYIPNGISLGEDSFHSSRRKRSDDYVLFAAGRIYEIKGLHLLLAALEKGKLKVHLKVAGDLDQVPEYREVILKSAKGLNVTFLGMIKDKAELMELVRGAKYFVFPSLTEAMSMMLLEVASVKTPVILSDIPANKAVFSDDEMLFFKSNDSDDLLSKMRFAEAYPEIMNEMSEKACIKLSSEFTWDNIAQKYHELYKKLLI